MTIDQDIEKIIESFNPGTYTPPQQSSALQPISGSKRLWNVLDKQAGASFYQALLSAISKISALVQQVEGTTGAEHERSKNFAKFLVLGIAARARVLDRSDIRQVELDCAMYMPFADVLWRELELFESVCRLMDALGIHRPEILQDEQQAWGRSFLREFARSIRPNTRCSMPLSLSDSLQRQSQYLRKNKNEAIFKNEPEKYLILDYALRLSYWDDSDVRLSHQASRDRSRLRNDIRQKLKNYKSALKSSHCSTE